MNQLSPTRLIAIVVSVALVPSLAQAVTVIIHVVPKYLYQQPYDFQFSAKDVDGMRHVTFKVSEKKKPLSAGLFAHLHLKTGNKEIATIPLKQTWSGGTATYWFDLSPSLSSDAEVEFDELYGSEKDNGFGHKIFEAVVGHKEYWFRLADFISK